MYHNSLDDILEMRDLLDTSENGCLSRTEMNLSKKIPIKNEKVFRKLLAEFYKKYHNQKDLGFLFTVSFLEQENKLINKIVNQKELIKIEQKYKIQDLTVFLVYYINEQDHTEDYYVNNTIRTENEFILAKNNEEGKNQLESDKRVKKVNVVKGNKDHIQAKINESEKLNKIKNDENVTRIHVKQGPSILSFFKKQ